jgi:hypothetical protein
MAHRTGRPTPPPLFNMQRQEIDQVDAVSGVGEATSVDPGATADIEHVRRGWGQMPPNQFQRANELQTRLSIWKQPVSLDPGVVMLASGRIVHDRDYPLPESAASREKARWPDCGT